MKRVTATEIATDRIQHNGADPSTLMKALAVGQPSD